MLCTLGDLVEDIAIRVDDPLNVASDTDARIERRRGGSAANVAATAARLGHPSRFVGQVGDDAIGRALVAELAAGGVDTGFVRFDGRTGTIVVLVDASGERTMLTDRGASSMMTDPSPSWLDGVSVLHVPLYSFAAEPMASTARQMVDWARERDVDVSVDVSSVALIDALGVTQTLQVIESLGPAVVFANVDEAERLGRGGSISGAVTVVKRGAAPATVAIADEVVEVAAIDVRGTDPDTTGAGDAFAAGFLTAAWRDDAAAACRAGHAAAASLISGR